MENKKYGVWAFKGSVNDLHDEVDEIFDTKEEAETLFEKIKNTHDYAQLEELEYLEWEEPDGSRNGSWSLKEAIKIHE